jgi:5-oxoprolinase (ATP-hydrolysing)
MLEDVTVSLITERRVSRPWGLAGGEPGAPGENWLLPGGDERRAQPLADKCTLHLRAGDVLRMLTPGGGGWGTLLADLPDLGVDAEDIAADVEDGRAAR